MKRSIFPPIAEVILTELVVRRASRADSSHFKQDLSRWLARKL
ncbi:MAG: hypothetical protein V7K55_20965 [Nostoc sp.]